MTTVPDSPEIHVRLGASFADKEDAIREAARILVESGCVDPGYEESMLRRERTADTFLGAGVAIPHGALEDKGQVRRDALAVVQVPEGVAWGPGRKATLVVGIAAASDGHIAILRRLAGLIQDGRLLAELSRTHDAAAVKAALLADSPAPQDQAAVQAEDLPERMEWTLDYPAGLHARPAAVWAEAAKSAGVPLRVRLGAETADPRNLVALLKLGARAGDVLRISAAGEGAPSALRDFSAIIAGLSEEEKQGAERAAARVPEPAADAWAPPGGDTARPVRGVGASPGLAVGSVFFLDEWESAVPDKPRSLTEDGDLLETALKTTRLQMKAVADDAARRLGASDAAIFRAQAALLDDADLIARACRHIAAGHGAAWAWSAAVEDTADELAALDNAVLAARAADLRDVGRRVLTRIEPSLAEGEKAPFPDGPVVVFAKDISPSDTTALDASKVTAAVTSRGGPASHTAILARTMGIAAVVAAGEGIFAARNGDTVIVDGDGGNVWLRPTPEALDAAGKQLEKQRAYRAAQAAKRGLPARTPDGVAFGVAANINRPDQVPLALEMGAEGVGLMRTEFLFLERGYTPGEDEQYEVCNSMAEALEGRPLIVRALDIGGDKRVAHLNLPREENPFLGIRGARLLLRRPDILEPQLGAVYRAAKSGGNISLMFPMISSVQEVAELRHRCEKIRLSRNAPEIPLGIMVEVPAAAVMADALAAHVDFFSIGTNDLTQYTLAMDRQNPDLAPEADSLHPAVLRLIRKTVQGAAGHGRWVGVCGGVAGTPFGAALLAGLGVAEFSMTPRDIPAVKSVLRGNPHALLAELAERAVNCANAAEVRALASRLRAL